MPLPRIHDYESGKFVLLDAVKFDFTLNQLLANPLMDQEIQEEATRALLEFARKTAIFSSIGDFHAQQLVYSKADRKWILLDWNQDTRFIPHPPTKRSAAWLGKHPMSSAK